MNSEETRGEQPRDKRDIQISKALSYLLRHGAAKEKLPIDGNGYVPIAALLAHNRLKTHKCTRDDLARVVANNDKKRFVVDTASDSIAATQGHSLQLKPDESVLAPVTDVAELPQQLIHGTNVRNCTLIVQSGKLSPMNRNHVHLSAGIVGQDKDVVSGMRASSNVYIYIKRDAETLAHLRLFKSLNNVYLCENEIPLQYFDRVEIRGSRDPEGQTSLARLLAEHGIAYTIV